MNRTHTQPPDPTPTTAPERAPIDAPAEPPHRGPARPSQDTPTAPSRHHPTQLTNAPDPTHATDPTHPTGPPHRTSPTDPLPPTATPAEWLSARAALLAEEKALTRALDDLAARRRALPMVAVEKGYVLTGPDGATGLLELFEGHDQLIVYHFMFAPEWEAGCERCAAFLDQIGDLRHLRERGTAFAAVSRAPYPRILPFKAAGGWTVPWYSAYGSDFPYDFGASFAPTAPAAPSPSLSTPTGHPSATLSAPTLSASAPSAPATYNYRPVAEADPGLSAALAAGEHVDRPALSCFLRIGEQVFHTYSAYARGLDRLGSASTLLDLTALGRRDHLARRTS